MKKTYKRIGGKYFQACEKCGTDTKNSEQILIVSITGLTQVESGGIFCCKRCNEWLWKVEVKIKVGVEFDVFMDANYPNINSFMKDDLQIEIITAEFSFCQDTAEIENDSTILEGYITFEGNPDKICEALKANPAVLFFTKSVPLGRISERSTELKLRNLLGEDKG